MADKKLLCVFLVVSLFCTSALGCLCLANAESAIPKPSVPEFTIDLIDSSYDVLPSSTVDPYTGQTIPIDGRHIESVTIKLSIKNQHYTPFMIKQEYGGDRAVFLHHVYLWKGAFEQDWHEYSPDLENYIPITLEEANNMPEFSVFKFDAQIISGNYEIKERGLYGAFPPEAKIEFQVKALIGYISWHNSPGGISGWMFTGEESGWSATKTVTLPAVFTVAATPAPSVSPPQDTPSTDNQSANSASDLEWLQVATVVLLGVIAVLLALAVFYLRKKSSINPPIRAT